MNKKIASEIAIGIILLLAIVVAGIFWLLTKKLQAPVQQAIKNQSVSVAQTQQQSVATQSVQQTPSNLTPKSYSDENVQWYDAPKEVTNIQLLKKGETEGYKIWDTGIIKTGEFAAGRLLLVVVDAQGPGGSSVYRFVQKKDDGLLYFMKNYSNDDFYNATWLGSVSSSDDWGSINKKLFSYMGAATYGLTISSLQYPGTIITPSGQQLKKEDDYPGVRDLGGIFFQTDLLKFAFTDPVYGDFYMTDVSKVTDENNASTFAENGFYVKAPDGTFRAYSSVVDLGGDVPKIIWNNGTQNSSKYSYKTENGCGASNYASDVSNKISQDDLVQLGKAENGIAVYGYKDPNDKALKDFYAEYQKLSNDDNLAGRYYDDTPKNLTYDQFLQTHPFFFVKDSFGRIIQFLNLHYIFSGGCGKPVIYLYPQQTENVSVQVTPTAGMSVSDPAYNGGWNVIADPQSNIFNLADNKTYPYLFWEGSGNSIYHMPQRGFVVEKENLNNFFDEKLAQEGLIQKEIDDFKDFWLPKMSAENKPYYFVTFVDRPTIDKLAPLNISPKPDTIIRVLMDYKGLDNAIPVQGFNIKTPQRKGFTAIEWGGVLK